MEQLTALIISDDREFSRGITSRWQAEREVPTFTLMSSDVLGFDPENFDLAIVGRIHPQSLSVFLEALNAAGKRIVFISEDATMLETVHERWPGIVTLQQEEDWLDVLVLVGSEALHRMRAEARAAHAEKLNARLVHESTLGRYMLEMRHTLNNTLTAMLGNSELLLLEPGALSAESRSQIETIRNMALRTHEILRRFSSLQKELSVVDRESEKGNRAMARAVV